MRLSTTCLKAVCLLPTAIASWGLLSGGLFAGVALASPRIASGDGLLNADSSACLSRADTFIDTLNVEVEKGQIVRTGYFEDGSFRILCYPNPYSQSNQSMVVVFAAHNDDFDVADTFVQIALSEIADPEAIPPALDQPASNQ